MAGNANKKKALWIGLICIIAGIVPMIASKPADGIAPWVAYLSCSVFILAGISLVSEFFGLIWVSKIIGPLILFCFTIIATWIGFAPGERECTGTISLPWMYKEGKTSCAPFKISAVLCWTIFIFALVWQIKDWRNSRKSGETSN